MSKKDVIVSASNVGKFFKLPHEQNNSIKGLLINFGKHGYEKQRVLDGISFEIKKGEFFGIVGRNGSGKSTLLKLLAGIYEPSKGSVEVRGRLTPFIELGVGFNPELTGRENVFLNGALLGFNRKEMSAMYDEIVAFAELERFMDQKLKNYSSGMQVRLAFSIAIRAKSDILLIDEVLAVGDAAFQTKCFDYFMELKKTNTTVIFVSHDRSSLERFCDRGILIDKGKITKSGNIKDVLQEYSKVVLDELDGHDKAEDAKKQESQKNHKKSEYAQIINVSSHDKDGNKKKKFTYGDDIAIGFEIKIKQNMQNPIIGVTVWDSNVSDKAIFATNTLLENIKETGNFKAGDVIEFKASLPNLLNDGEYFIEPAIANESATIFYDQQLRAANFLISGSDNPHSIISKKQKIIFRKKTSKKG